MEPELARSGYDLGNDARDWKVALAQEDLKSSGPDKKYIVPILYRPFDIRYTYYTGKSRGFICMPRPEVMQHMLKPNLALSTHRREELKVPYTHFLVTDKITEHGLMSGKTTNYQFPLYLYSSSSESPFLGQEKLDLEGTQHSLRRNVDRTPNINWNVLPEWMVEATPEQIFYYIYAVLYSDIYRKKYQEFLKSDFPKVPFPPLEGHRVFYQLSALGEQLADLHLLRAKTLDNPPSKYEGQGNDKVEKRDYREKMRILYINDRQYFDKILPEVWNYRIGGYQVLDKWLKDRTGHALSLDDQLHFRKITTTLGQTIDLQKRIDKFYPKVEKAEK